MIMSPILVIVIVPMGSTKITYCINVLLVIRIVLLAKRALHFALLVTLQPFINISMLFHSQVNYALVRVNQVCILI